MYSETMRIRRPSALFRKAGVLVGQRSALEGRRAVAWRDHGLRGVQNLLAWGLIPVPCSLFPCLPCLTHPGGGPRRETQSTDSTGPDPIRCRAPLRWPHRCRAWEPQEQGVLVPEHVRPRRIADRQADIHAQQHAQEQLGALQPAGNALRSRAGRARAEGGLGQKA